MQLKIIQNALENQLNCTGINLSSDLSPLFAGIEESSCISSVTRINSSCKLL